jgi:hypothetical protein
MGRTIQREDDGWGSRRVRAPRTFYIFFYIPLTFISYTTAYDVHDDNDKQPLGDDKQGRPQTGTTINRDDHKRRRPQIGTTTNGDEDRQRRRNKAQHVDNESGSSTTVAPNDER